MLEFQCPNCNAGLWVTERYAGQPKICPSCRWSLIVPADSPLDDMPINPGKLKIGLHSTAANFRPKDNCKNATKTFVFRTFTFGELEHLAQRMFVPRGCPVRRSGIDLDAETVTIVYGGGEHPRFRRVVPIREIIAYYCRMHPKEKVVE